MSNDQRSPFLLLITEIPKIQMLLENIREPIISGRIDTAIAKLPKGLQDDATQEIAQTLREDFQRVQEILDSILGVIEKNTDLKVGYRDLVDEHG